MDRHKILDKPLPTILDELEGEVRTAKLDLSDLRLQMDVLVATTADLVKRIKEAQRASCDAFINTLEERKEK